MKNLPFKRSDKISIGIELEFQIIDPITYNLIPRAKDLIRNISSSSYQKWLKPEITQSMIELNSSVHHSPQKMYEELVKVRSFLLNQSKKLGVYFSGGGTHPFQKWSLNKIFPSKRFKNLSHRYRYLSKRSTVFGQHVHIGCPSAEDALYLTHAFARYVPQFLALSASSPFYQGLATGYASSRANVFSAFPMSGVIPYLTTWEEFSEYYYKMRKLGIIESMKDFYWDIRPKPEFGTVEVRVCDTPFTLKKAVTLAAYMQTLAYYLLEERPALLTPDLYYVYGYNRFQACRYGYGGQFIDPQTLQHRLIGEDILLTLKTIKKYATKLNNTGFLSLIAKDVTNNKNDASLANAIFNKTDSLPRVVREQCLLWMKN